MTFRYRDNIVVALGACALSFSLALTGCGGSSATDTSSDTEAVSEQVATDTVDDGGEATEEVVLSEDLAAIGDATKGVIESGDTSAAEGFDELPVSDDAEAAAVEKENTEIGESDGQTDKATTNSRTISVCGITLDIPAAWFTSQDDLGFLMQDPTGAVSGRAYGIAKAAGVGSIDVEALAKAVPGEALKQGFTNVSIIKCQNYYSASGALCDSCILYTATKNGVEYALYAEMIESKSYVNCVELYTKSSDFSTFASDMDFIVSSISFAAGEAI